MKTRRSPTPSSRSIGDNFPDRVREALRPLLTDDALVESTALKIQRLMAFKWHFAEHSSFFNFEGKVSRVVSHFACDGLTRADYLHAALRRVTLFFQNPETLIANIEGVTNHFQAHGLTRTDYLRCALEQPQLFYQKPRTLISNIDRVVKHFKDDGLTCEDYLRAAVQQPSLFYRKPVTIIHHVDLITDLYRKGFLRFNDFAHLPQTDAAPVIEYMLHNSPLFLMSEDNIALREQYARITDPVPSKKILMRSSRRRIEQELAQALAKGKLRASSPLVRRTRPSTGSGMRVSVTRNRLGTLDTSVP
jgi:hypothetical protein